MVVTAQKREESLQDVPLSIQALGTTRLEELHVTSFNDYVKFLPSVSFQSIGPGAASVYMRGVASGENSNHSGPQPSVGIYLDEQPITTIQGALDVRIYDIARVEALAGPQGTLYGASSQAGTIRIITNKPDPSGFDAGFDLEGNTVEHGGQGYAAEGFVNIPLRSNAAIRLVGWAAHDAGFIDNVYGERTFPTWGGTINNAAYAKKDYNDVETYGARAALKIDLNDSWTVTPQLMGQKQEIGGFFGYDPSVGDLKLTHYRRDNAKDSWLQAALTVEGRIANLDLVYAGAYLKRKYDSDNDYNDYSFYYDTLFGYGAYFYDDDGTIVDPSQYFIGRDHFKKQSHELRLSSSKDNRAYFVAGLFYQRQQHDIEQNYRIDAIGDSISVTGWPGTIWLTEQVRVDRDYAAFGEVTFKATDRLSLTGGVRFFKSDNSLMGFFGYGAGFSGSTGEAACTDPPTVGGGINGAPCTNLDKSVDETGNTIKLNATYRFSEGNLLLRDLLRGLPAGRHQPPRHAAALRRGLPEELRIRLEAHDRRQPAALQRRAVRRGLGRHPVLLPRPQRPDRDQERRCGPHRRHRGGLQLRGHAEHDLVGRLRLPREQIAAGLLRGCRQPRLPGRAERHAAAGHAAVQGEPDRTLPLHSGRFRCVRAGRRRAPGQQLVRPARRRSRRAGRPGHVHDRRPVGRH
ncbi:MAG: TonB-dependent receptor plug domain-containing protein, partial [Steroidobacteraceae bacterium]|nr:TonB-dependent receptor plug domain-containing protein [Steroidobacteraceae bacterium]